MGMAPCFEKTLTTDYNRHRALYRSATIYFPTTPLMRNEHLIIYHGDCPDGFGAAYAAWRSFGDKASYLPARYGDSIPAKSLADRHVYVFDFSFPPEELKAMAQVAQSVIQIDHHASALNAWGDRFNPEESGLQTWKHPELPLTVSFDMEKSGARLAWEYFYPNDPLPWPLRHVEDQDLWRFALPATRAFNRALRLLPYDFHAWDGVIKNAGTPASKRYQSMLAEGEAIERFVQGEIERLANGPLVMPVDMPGAAIGLEHALRESIPVISMEQGTWRVISGLAINANSLFTSELGERLAEKCGSFALLWYAHSDGEVKCSLRSRGKVDVAVMAEKFGGGGHRNAAGFRIPLIRFVSGILKCAL